ncbi:MAG: NAD(P)/FAD-dependent oxidoreductase, partial [Pyrinomonadaceae bacterium]
GHDAGYRPNGYLFLATDEGHLAQLAAARERQQAAGLTNVELLSAADIKSLVPQLRTDDVRGGSYCPTDGLLSPLDALAGFMSRARQFGVELWLDTQVSKIETDGRGVAGVETSRGRVATRAVVNAAGAWAAEVAGTAGLELPVTPLRRQLIGVRTRETFSTRLPMVIDLTDGFHFRSLGPAGDAAGTNTLRLAWPDPDATPGFATEFDPTFITQTLERAARRVPCLAAVEEEPSERRAGLYEMTPDRHAIICEAPTLPGLFLANGFSGHGVMHSPATGRAVSDLILRGGTNLFGLTPLSLERFASGSLNEEGSLL